MYDYIVVGAGLSGSIIARFLAEEKRKKVLVVDKREHLAGNVYDYVEDNNILVQQYGPHIFHTNSDKVWKYVNRFADWNEYGLECMVYMNGKYTPSPFNFQTIDNYFPGEQGIKIKEHIKEVYGDREKATIVELLECEDEVIKKYAQFLYDNDYSLYTAKQWGISPKEIDISVLKRVPVLFSYKKAYFDDKYQAMPVNGFTKFVEDILDCEGIDIQLGVNAVDLLELDEEKGQVFYRGESVDVVYTGAIDEIFAYRYGKLPYRSLRFEWKTLNQESYQDAPVVAYPQEAGFTRITEYKKLPKQEADNKTTIAIEYPLQATGEDVEPYYPIPTVESEKAYERYKVLAEKYKNLHLCGRLAEYKYYNMDQVIERALECCDNL